MISPGDRPNPVRIPPEIVSHILRIREERRCRAVRTSLYLQWHYHAYVSPTTISKIFHRPHVGRILLKKYRPGPKPGDAPLQVPGRSVQLDVKFVLRVGRARQRFYQFTAIDEATRSHAAIERILKHEPGLQRVELWQRIRRLKNPERRNDGVRSAWSAEDERILREGYQAGWQGKREAVSQLLKRHPDWRPHVIWNHATKLGLAEQGASKRGQERSRCGWSEDDDRLLFDLSGYKRVGVISKLLHRSEAAVRGRLALLGKSSRVHLEGFARSTLARELHLSTSLIQRLIVEGLLEVRDPRVTRESLDRLQRSGRLEEMRRNGVPTPANSAESSAISSRPSRAKRVWGEVAASLSVKEEVLGRLIARGVLKLYDPRITEKSLRNFCRRHGSLINSDFLNRETREWLQSTMDFVPHAGEAVALCLTPLRKHARVVHQCTKCGRTIRGNVFFRHNKRCSQRHTPSDSTVS